MSNTKSIALAKSSSQYLSRLDTNLSSGFPGKSSTGSSGSFTLMGWFQFSQLPSTAGSNFHLVNKIDFTSSTTLSYRIIVRSVNTIRVQYYNSSSSQSRIDTSAVVVNSADITNSNWIHLGIAVNVSAATMIVYKNGTSIGTTVLDSGASSVRLAAEPFLLGAGNESGTIGAFFDGKMDEIGFYDAALSSTTIIADYNSGNGTERSSSESNLVAGWRFEDALTDISGDGNTLTNNGSATYSTDVPFSGGAAAAVDDANFFGCAF